MSKLKSTRKKLSQVEWPTDLLNELNFLQMSEKSEVHLVFATSFVEDSHVKTSALLEVAQAWQESEAAFSTKLSDSQKKYVQRLCSSRTCQQLELEDFMKSSEHLPKSGMTVDGHVYLPQALEHHTKESDGSYLPTPTAQSYGTSNNGNRSDGSTFKTAGKLSLNSMARHNLWPPPTVCGNNQNKKIGNTHLIGLATAVKIYSKKVTGQLNPTWVEWLMGLPLGYTELKPLVTE